MIALLVSLVLTQTPDVEPVGAPPADPPVQVVAPPAATVTVMPAPLEGFEWNPVAEVFGEYGARWATDTGFFNAFDVPRVQAGVEAQWKGVKGRVLLEGARSTEGGAIIGTGGDSVVIRLREGWAGYRWNFLEAKLGMIAVPVIAQLERGFQFRALTADGLERYRLQSPADLGASVRAHLPRDFGFVALSAFNGEGYTFRELNNGKNLDLTAMVKPLALTHLNPLGVLLSGRLGTSGLGSVRSDRFGGGLLWNTSWLGLGATAFYAVGVGDDAFLRSLLFQAFARGAILDRLLWAVRVHWLKRDLDASADDSLTELLAGVGVSIFGPLEVFLCVQKSWLSPIARAALPGVEALSGRLVVRLRWPAAVGFE